MWKAAAALWTALGRAGPIRDAVIQIDKRIPVQAGLGGGSADAAAALVALARLWGGAPITLLREVGATIGADVPFFLSGGTALGLGRGEEIYPLVDLPPESPLRDFLAGDDPFLVVYGDVLTDLQLEPVLADHRRARADATIVLTQVDDPRRAGMVELDPAGWVQSLIEKPAQWTAGDAWANAGVYLLGPRVLDFVPPEGFHDFAFDLFPALIARWRAGLGVRSDAQVVDIGSHERLADGNGAGRERASPAPAGGVDVLIARAPLRISFAGGGTDLEAYYAPLRRPGRERHDQPLLLRHRQSHDRRRGPDHLIRFSGVRAPGARRGCSRSTASWGTSSRSSTSSGSPTASRCSPQARLLPVPGSAARAPSPWR